MKRLTLEDIGKMAGVSRATVSRVVNGHPNISHEVRQRVQDVIDETGYRPNVAARQLASNRSNIIGLMIPSTMQRLFTDTYFLLLLQGVAQACNSNDYTLSLFLFHTLEEEQSTVRRVMGTGLLDGLLISTHKNNNWVLGELRSKGIPHTLIGQFSGSHEATTLVDVDNRDGARAATKHLIDLGYKRVATICATRNAAANERLAGYKLAMQEADLPLEDDLVAVGDFSKESGYTAMQSLLQHKPDAVFAASDAMGVGALQAIQDAGLSVPGDIAVVGFDDLPHAETTNPPLTTVRQPITRMGARAVELLIELIETQEDIARQIILPTELIVRQSCGALSE